MHGGEVGCIDEAGQAAARPLNNRTEDHHRSSEMAPAATAVIRMGSERQRQRYDEHRQRLVAGCVPYRLRGGDEDGSSVEVLMVSTPKRHDLVFPKGGWEIGEGRVEAACRETLEEAGVRGIIHHTEAPLGEWVFRSKSSEAEKGCGGSPSCRGYMFALQVTEELDAWPEQATHGRRWVPLQEAYAFCRYQWMREALDRLKDRLLNH